MIKSSDYSGGVHSNIIVLMIALYMFIAPLGNLARFSPNEGSYGTTTILLVIIVLITITLSLKILFTEKVFRMFFVLFIWLLSASILSHDPESAFLNGGSLFIYLMASMATYALLDDLRIIYYVLTAFCLGGLISSFATIIDFIGIVDIPGVNDIHNATLTDIGAVEQASGVFPRRSAMGAYYVMIITIGVLLSIIGRSINNKMRFMFLFSGLSCMIALLLTHTRTAIISSFVMIILVMIIRSKNSKKTFRQLLLIIGIIFVIFNIAEKIFPDIMMVYETKLYVREDVSSIEELGDSDILRFVFAEHALSSLLSNPFGNGYSMMVGVDGFGLTPVDPHNIITQIIWGAGVFGLMWVIYIIYKAASFVPLIKAGFSIDTCGRQIWIVIVAGLIAFIINNMMHNSLSTGVAWILFGAAIRLGNGLQIQEHSELYDIIKNRNNNGITY